MRIFRADLHIHTLLSPCGDLEMSPVNIISEAVRTKLDIIGITDHNSTRQSGLVKRFGKEKGIFVMQGAEVTTKEEVHCLAFFENSDTLDQFQKYLDSSLPDVLNDPIIFGDQVVVDENEDIVFTEKRLLTNATSISIKDLEIFVHGLNGIFIPAHIDRLKNSVYSQLGFLPDDLNADALEISARTSPVKFAQSHPDVNPYTLITDSDAHYPGSIGTVFNNFEIESPSFEEIRLALAAKEGRRLVSK